jgi:hypothetical protein
MFFRQSFLAKRYSNRNLLFFGKDINLVLSHTIWNFISPLVRCAEAVLDVGCGTGTLIMHACMYPSYSGVLSRIEGFLFILEGKKIKAWVICRLIQRSSSLPVEQSLKVYYIDLRIVRAHKWNPLRFNLLRGIQT